MTDFRALCAELTNELSGYKMANPMHDWFLLNRARAALAEHSGGPTKAEIHSLADDILDGDRASRVDFARAILARWGQPAVTPMPLPVAECPHCGYEGEMAPPTSAAATAPVPVSALVPVLEEDCDAEGRCWWGATALFGSATGNIPHSWRLCRPVDRFGSELVWLPAHALPVPTND